MLDRDQAAGFLSAAFLMMGSLTPSARAAPDAPGGLERRADWGFGVRDVKDEGVQIMRVRAGSTAAVAGLADGDRLRTLGGVPVGDAAGHLAARRAFHAGDRVRLGVVHDGASRDLSFTLAALPLEAIPGCEVEYRAARSPRGYEIRLIVTRPEGVSGRLPAVVFVPWLSCDAVESPLAPARGMTRLLQELAPRSGWCVVRLEKPGVGDSGGPDCSANDLEADLDAFRAGIAEVRGMAGVDSTRIVLFGGSIGGALVPLLAAEHPVAGLIVSGGFSRTWFEHILEFERNRLTLGGSSPAEVNRALRGFAEFYALYLGQRLTPAQVLARRPDLATLWYDAPGGQYGRPAAYFHQVAALDPEGAWAKLDAPVLVLYGDCDRIMSRAEHDHIVELVNARHSGRATLVVLPRTDHDLETYPSREAALAGRDPGFDETLVDRVGAWLHANVR